MALIGPSTLGSLAVLAASARLKALLPGTEDPGMPCRSAIVGRSEAVAVDPLAPACLFLASDAVAASSPRSMLRLCAQGECCRPALLVQSAVCRLARPPLKKMNALFRL